MDAVEKKEVRADLIDKVDIKDQDTVTGKYIAKVRKAASKSIAKRLTWCAYDSINISSHYE